MRNFFVITFQEKDKLFRNYLGIVIIQGHVWLSELRMIKLNGFFFNFEKTKLIKSIKIIGDDSSNANIYIN